jgi:hypothetical protein
MSAARAFSTALRAGAPRAPIAARVAGIRSYAAATATSAANKPPVALFGVDGTYASALVRIPGNQLPKGEMLEDEIGRQWIGLTRLYSTPRLRKQTPSTLPPSRSRRCPPSSRRTPSSPRSYVPPRSPCPTNSKSSRSSSRTSARIRRAS